ncbi:TM0996/MTH895 family glutaredoxin-like protein [Patescibacteria group bacterium]|nr:TM0996/MTH895 family glutaredoxin-like protein [Patescibacteria group bacterium]MBU1016464.1 TM0996/MTH895 family glutaredoxin-like protein [Patescibacteria group bacterium]MBU1684962.1 TM0996/MTH895 family glutaredoxin-like protein [Patescibacteria group bacterium]MBU1939010.1 TM0996/MTH895 family glutaredoxin-like protein [Patescibacteria group bacterium]
MTDIKVQVLGLGCAKCKSLYELVKGVASKFDPSIEVEYVTDITRIAELGVMSTPVFAVNGQVVTAGRIPKENEIHDALNSL